MNIVRRGFDHIGDIGGMELFEEGREVFPQLVADAGLNLFLYAGYVVVHGSLQAISEHPSDKGGNDEARTGTK